MNDHGTPGSAEGFGVFAVDAAWPQSRQITGHGHNPAAGDIHVYLWFGHPYFDPEVEHVSVFSGSSGNAQAGEALEQAFEDAFDPDGEAPAGLPASEPVTVTADGSPREFELWRNSGNGYWVARGRVGSTEVVLSGSGIEPGELSLVRVSDLTTLSSPLTISGSSHGPGVLHHREMISRLQDAISGPAQSAGGAPAGGGAQGQEEGPLGRGPA
ncbi:hypothetical protein [Streptomyces sp. NPDC020917]|uniref:hypothetical protein n=1 Tax=Streptomyces sp. NPDC020917 TaxID=3365102 RepID=UPI0037A37909